MSELTPNLKLFKYNTETDAKQPFSINDCMNANWDKIDASLGSLEICDIGMALYVDETKGKRRYLNGQIVDRNANTEAFFTRLQEITTLYPSLLCTEEEWQTAKTMSAFGQVGKFVFNYSGDEIVSVRIPAIVNVQGLFDLQNLGLTLAESLPNIRGTFNTGDRRTHITGTSGAIYNNTVSSAQWGAQSNASGNTQGVAFDASRSHSTYQDGAPVQQEAIQYPYFIQIATGSETENNIINDIELNNPYSLFECKYADHELFNLSWLVSNGSYNGSNAVHPSAYQALLVENNAEVAIGSTVTLPNGVKYTKQGLSVKLSTETYTDYDFVLNTTEGKFRLPIKPRNLNNTRYLIDEGEQNGISYRVYSDGYCEQFGKTASIASNQQTTVTFLKKFKDTNISVILQRADAGFGNYTPSYNSLTTSGMGIWNNDTANNASKISWYAYGYLAEEEYAPLTDNISLYYYIGETVQNANLIDAGRIGEQLANKQDKCIHITETYVNGTSGYRIWSDGYCEQWGRVNISGTDANNTVNFVKTFKDTNYVVVEASFGNTDRKLTLVSLNTSNMVIKGWSNLSIWKACGYLASGQY